MVKNDSTIGKIFTKIVRKLPKCFKHGQQCKINLKRWSSRNILKIVHPEYQNGPKTDN